MDQPTSQNRLREATSPYLLQHADNPVHWQPWDQAALDAARRDDKPILLSVGYSSCHWCHVMAHESFEDTATAELMNRLFVNIKVDREERPDLDKIYQAAHQLLTQRGGGWPLTVFLTPDDHIPFFAGTYFPKEARQGLASFRDLLTGIGDFWAHRRDELGPQNKAILEALKQIAEPPGKPASELTDAPLRTCRDALAASYDRRFGGFSGAPKFPHPTSVECLLRYYGRSMRDEKPDRDALHMACVTLRRMALGGIYDQVGGGFARYSVDPYWMIPHFEKMLYDNGALLALYADAWQATGDKLFARIAGETAEWLTEEMQAPEGGYYSSLDADSEGHEGKFYVWTPQEISAHLTNEEFELASRRFGLDEPANFEGRWHLNVNESFSESARALNVPRERVVRLWAQARSKLKEARSRRVPPGRDEKVLASWNALAIKGMARAGRLLGENRFVESAERALEFLRRNLWRDGRLLASFRDGKAHIPGYLDDYAFTLDAVLELLQCRWRNDDAHFAVSIADALLAHFADPREGSFFFTADDQEPLIQRPRALMDESTPAGNGVAAAALNRLGHMFGDMRYRDAAERCLKACFPSLVRIPHAHGALLIALEEFLDGPEIVFLRGEEDACREWRTTAQRYYQPSRLVVTLPLSTPPRDWLPWRGGDPTPAAYVCRAGICQLPALSISELEDRLNDAG